MNILLQLSNINYFTIYCNDKHEVAMNILLQLSGVCLTVSNQMNDVWVLKLCAPLHLSLKKIKIIKLSNTNK